MMEDEPQFMSEVTEYFRGEGMEVVGCVNGEQARRLFAQQRFDLVLLDIMIGSDFNQGFRVCQWIHQKDRSVPVIFCSARKDEMDQERGYEFGCHDYVTKPYSVKLLHLKIKNMITHTETLRRSGNTLSLQGITIDDERKTVSVDGRAVHLTPRQFELLQALMENAGRTMSREQLLTQVWNYGLTDDERIVDRHILKLRKALGDRSEEYIRTMHGYGYCFVKEG